MNLRFTDEASRNLSDLESNRMYAKRLKAVRKALGLLETNVKHPGFHTIHCRFEWAIKSSRAMPKVRRPAPIESFGTMGRVAK